MKYNIDDLQGLIEGARKTFFPRVTKTESKNEVTYDFNFSNGSNLDVTIGKAVPFREFLFPALDAFVSKDPEVAEVDPDLETKL